MAMSFSMWRSGRQSKGKAGELPPAICCSPRRRCGTFVPRARSSATWRSNMRGRILILALTGLAALGNPPAVRADDTTDFFNGKNFDGWEGLTNDYWSVKDGAIVGSTPKGLPFNTFLCSKRKYKDFEVKFEVKLTG